MYDLDMQTYPIMQHIQIISIVLIWNKSSKGTETAHNLTALKVTTYYYSELKGRGNCYPLLLSSPLREKATKSVRCNVVYISPTRV